MLPETNIRNFLDKLHNYLFLIFIQKILIRLSSLTNHSQRANLSALSPTIEASQAQTLPHEKLVRFTEFEWRNSYLATILSQYNQQLAK